MCLAILTATVWVVLKFVSHAYGEQILLSFAMLPILFYVSGLLIDRIALRRIKQAGFEHVIKNNTNDKRFPVYTLLMLSPIIGSFGCSLPQDWIAVYYLTPIMGLTALLISKRVQNMHIVVLSAFSLYLILMGMFHYIQYPFGLNSLYKQKVVYKGIKYEPDTASYLFKLERVLNDSGFFEEQGMIVERTPGIVYLMGSFQPGGILFDNTYLNYYMNNLGKTELQYKPVIISHTWYRLKSVDVSMSGDRDNPFYLGLSNATGIDFYEDYYLASSVSNSEFYTRIYVPKVLEIDSQKP